VSVWQLYGALLLSNHNHSLTRREAADVVWRLAEEGEVELEYIPAATFVEFLRHWERNLTIYVSFAIALVTILAIYMTPVGNPLVVIRWIFGAIFVVFIPGFVATGALFPKIGDLNSLERFALSIGLSLALVMLVGLVLNYTLWGITVSSTVFSLALVTVLLGMITLVRQYGVF